MILSIKYHFKCIYNYFASQLESTQEIFFQIQVKLMRYKSTDDGNKQLKISVIIKLSLITNNENEEMCNASRKKNIFKD